MEYRYYYKYAEIDPETNMCIGVHSTTTATNETDYWVAIPVFDEEYIFKYYINGSWYEDEAGTIPWQSSLL